MTTRPGDETTERSWDLRAFRRSDADAWQASATGPALTVLFHPDLERVGAVAWLPELDEGERVGLSRNAPVFMGPSSADAKPLATRAISRKPVDMWLAGETLWLDAASGGTPIAIDGEPVTGRVPVEAARLDRGVVVTVGDRIVLLVHRRAPPRALEPSATIIGVSAAITDVRAALERVADLEVGVLILGPTGVGKELVARALHAASKRADGPFIAVNAGAIPASVGPSALFGHRRGAFTGAERDHPGYLGSADGGTLLLDEVGDLAESLQPTLLRALESGELQRVGDSEPRAVDVRVIAATEANLDEAAQRGAFRPALLQRLGQYRIEIPPLDRRRDDIGLLSLHLLEMALEITGEVWRLRDPAIGPELAALIEHLTLRSWPGNVRELANVVRSVAIDSRGAARLVFARTVKRQPSRDTSAPKTSRPSAEVSDDELLVALRDSRWNMTAAAQRLGIGRSTLYRRIEASPRIRHSGELSDDEIHAAFEAADGSVTAMVERLEVSPRGLRRRLSQLGLV